MLFREWHKEPILNGEKTQTRRFWKKARAKVGSIHKCKTKIFTKKYFAKIRILRVWQEKVGDISIEDAKAEGNYSREEFWEAIAEINNLSIEEAKERTCWALDFELVKEG